MDIAELNRIIKDYIRNDSPDLVTCYVCQPCQKIVLDDHQGQSEFCIGCNIYYCGTCSKGLFTLARKRDFIDYKCNKCIALEEIEQ